jgi:hypothetical protein
MDNPISPETRERIDDLCRRISISRGLDDEIRAELAAHMEDKLRAYLSGAEKLTEENAFVLVQEHFGNPEHVHDLLAGVHAEELHGNFARCLGAILAATLGSRVLLFLLLSMYFTPLFHFFRGPISDTVRFLEPIPIVLIEIGVIALFWFVLYRWQKARAFQKKLWFLTIKPMYFAALLFSLSFFLAIVYQPFSAAIEHSNMGPISGSHTVLRPIQDGLFFLMVPFSDFLWPLVWLWWFGMVSRWFLTPLFGFIFWELYFCLLEPFLWHLFHVSLGLSTGWAMHNLKVGLIAFFTYLLYAGLMDILKKRNQPVIE